ncbi:uncharacterized protein bou [Chelonus insularis]|uniref:uncharacterized protein bou n=1 Tax=Chelonus insularis TaxID=460826 RepID=UPI00158F1D51|nr:uncharacterized protein LOC118069927 [Chelonus insularis]
MGPKNVTKKIFIFIGLFTFYFVPAKGINCYQCASTNNTNIFQCNEFLTDDIDMQPKSCDGVFGAKYCIKHVGRFEGNWNTQRLCSSLDLDNSNCPITGERQPGDTLTYRTCVYTCSTDGCNYK